MCESASAVIVACTEASISVLISALSRKCMYIHAHTMYVCVYVCVYVCSCDSSLASQPYFSACACALGRGRGKGRKITSGDYSRVFVSPA